MSEIYRERLKAAIEGECHGLAISDKQAAAVLAHLFEWISFADKKPGLNETVLTCDIAFREHGIEGEEMIGDDEWSSSYFISHWLPTIPLPLKK